MQLLEAMETKQVMDGMIKIYMEEFTTPELKELATFYRTPTGRKAMHQNDRALSRVNDRNMSSRMLFPIAGIAICMAVVCVTSCANKAESKQESRMQYARFTTFVVDLSSSESTPSLDSPKIWWLNTRSSRYRVDGLDARLPIWQSMVKLAVLHKTRLYVEVDPKNGLVKEIFNTKNDFVESVGAVTDGVVTVHLRRRPTRVTLSVDDPKYEVMKVRLEHAAASQIEVRVTVHPYLGTLLNVEELD